MVCAGIFSAYLNTIYVKFKITEKDECCLNHVIFLFFDF